MWRDWNFQTSFSRVWRDWLFQKTFSGVGRLNISDKHLPAVERLNISKNIFRCGKIDCFRQASPGCGEIKYFRKHFPVWGDWIFQKSISRVWKDWKFQKHFSKVFLYFSRRVCGVNVACAATPRKKEVSLVWRDWKLKTSFSRLWKHWNFPNTFPGCGEIEYFRSGWDFVVATWLCDSLRCVKKRARVMGKCLGNLKELKILWTFPKFFIYGFQNSLRRVRGADVVSAATPRKKKTLHIRHRHFPQIIENVELHAELHKSAVILVLI